MAIEHMCFVTIREMQINTTLGFHFSLVTKPTKFQKFDEHVDQKLQSNC